MKKFNEDFRQSLREIRQLNALVGYYDDKGFYILTTEEDDNLLTQNEFEIATESGIIEYDKETIISVNPLFNVSLFKTTCKSVQIESKNKINVGTYIKTKIGVYKSNKNKYEYLNYGDYYINEEPVYQADSDSYLITGYDKMIESMVNYDDNPLSITFPIKHKDFVIAICNKLGWKYNLIDYPNADKIIQKNFYIGQGLTYRDILDDLNGVCGGSFMFNLENKLIWKRPTETGQIVEDDDLKDTNVDFSEKYGKVNALTITTNGNVVLAVKEDSESIAENGKTEININDNYILNYSTGDFIDEIFNEVNGLEYYLYDVDSTGLLIFEPLDIFTFRHNGVDYKTIMFNDDIKLTQGLVETTYAEKPEEEKKDYNNTNKEENKLNNALISLDRANAEVVLKVNSAGNIAQVRLDGDADGGSIIEINSDQVDLNANDILNLIAGNTINLTSKNIKIDSTNFKVDEKGNINANNGIFNGIINGSTINGGSINLSSEGERAKYTIIDNENHNCKFEQSARSIKWYGLNNGFITIWNTGSNPIIGLFDNNEGLHTNLNAWYIETPELRQTSLEKSKKNFEKFDGALNIINDIDLYKYNLKQEKDYHKKHIGFVIGDKYNYSSEITSVDEEGNETGVDLYSMTSLCLQAIKEQQEKIELLEKQLNDIINIIKESE